MINISKIILQQNSIFIQFWKPTIFKKNSRTFVCMFNKEKMFIIKCLLYVFSYTHVYLYDSYCCLFKYLNLTVHNFKIHLKLVSCLLFIKNCIKIIRNIFSQWIINVKGRNNIKINIFHNLKFIKLKVQQKYIFTFKISKYLCYSIYANYDDMDLTSVFEKMSLCHKLKFSNPYIFASCNIVTCIYSFTIKGWDLISLNMMIKLNLN